MKSHQKLAIACLSALAAMSMYGCDKGETIGGCITVDDCPDPVIFTCDIGRSSCVDQSKKLDCNNGVEDEAESDVDCGGVCDKKCELEQSCDNNEDCESGRCEKSECVEATCSKDKDCKAPAHSCNMKKGVCNTCTDGVQNGDETDKDCGGPCSPCKLNKGCDADEDCLSGLCDPDESVCIQQDCEKDSDCPKDAVYTCDDGHCISCFDGVKNGDETDVDCGGSCSLGCAGGNKCKKNKDCASGKCESKVCVDDSDVELPKTCSNKKQDGNETDVDCGGGECNKCEDGKDCKKNSDCSSGKCEEGTCAEDGEDPQPGETCSNSKKDGDETDTDCGGSCSPCANGKSCSANGDCTSGNCDGGVCAESSGPGPGPAGDCNDSAKNGDESDTDCGGSCSACADGKACYAPTDCVSGKCEGGVCVSAGPSVSCSDGIKNGDESDTDCGGSCAQKCDNEKACNSNDDCLSFKCEGNLCKGADCKMVSGSGQIIVNEIFTNPNTSAKMEHSNNNQMKFIELYNTTGDKLYLRNLKLSVNEAEIDFSESCIDAKKYLVIYPADQNLTALDFDATSMKSNNISSAIPNAGAYNVTLIQRSDNTPLQKAYIPEIAESGISAARPDSPASNENGAEVFIKHSDIKPADASVQNPYSPGLANNVGIPQG